MNYQDMKVYFVNKFNWFTRSPMATVSTFSTYAMALAGADVTFIVSGTPTQNTNVVLWENYGLEPLDNYKIVCLSRPRVLGKKFTWAFYNKAYNTIRSSLDPGKLNVVFSRNSTFLPRLAKLKRRHGVFTAFESHGYHGDLTIRGITRKSRNLFQRLGSYRLVKKRCLNEMDLMVYITGPMRQLYERDYVTSPGIVLPLGAPKPMISGMAVSRQRKMLIYTGRLTDHIDYMTIFYAMKTLGPDGYKFTWIGLRDDNIKTLRPIIANLNLHDYIVLKGWMAHADMVKTVRKLGSCGIAAYRPTFRSAAVTSPTKIFDYYAIGLPVIASDLPTIRDVLSQGCEGMFYTPGDSDSFIQQVRYIHRDENMYRAYAKNALARANKLSWTNRSNSLLDEILRIYVSK